MASWSSYLFWKENRKNFNMYYILDITMSTLNLFLILKYSWMTILYYIQVYSIVIWYFYTLCFIQSYWFGQKVDSCFSTTSNRKNPERTFWVIHCYNVIDCIPCAVYYIPVTYLVCNWWFMPINSLHLLPIP